MVRYRKRVCIVNRVESRCMIMDHLTVEVSKLQYHDMSVQSVCVGLYSIVGVDAHSTRVCCTPLYYMYKPARKIVIASVSKTAEHIMYNMLPMSCRTRSDWAFEHSGCV